MKLIFALLVAAMGCTADNPYYIGDVLVVQSPDLAPVGSCGRIGDPCCVDGAGRSFCAAGECCEGVCAAPDMVTPPDLSPPPDLLPAPGTIGARCETDADCGEYTNRIDMHYQLQCFDLGPPHGRKCCAETAPTSWNCAT